MENKLRPKAADRILTEKKLGPDIENLPPMMIMVRGSDFHTSLILPLNFKFGLYEDYWTGAGPKKSWFLHNNSPHLLVPAARYLINTADRSPHGHHRKRQNHVVYHAGSGEGAGKIDAD